jgi:hypothetical protein
MDEILVNTAATLSVDFSAGAADGSVTVTVTRDDGTVLVNAATAVHGAAGSYSYALAPVSEIDQLTIRWAGSWGGVAQSVTTYAEVVGGLLFTLAELRDFGDGKLASSSEYPDSLLIAKRADVTGLFEQVCAVSFIPRYAKDTLEGRNRRVLRLAHRRPNRLLTVTVNGTALSSNERAQLDLYPDGRIDHPAYWPANLPRRNVVVAYEHGYKIAPARIKTAALTLARYELISTDLSDRTVSLSTDLGAVRLSVPGEKYPTGIPVVDAALIRFSEAEAWNIT